jgi:putative tricarboxylic transport membrane protein
MLRRYKFPLAPIVLGIVLGPMIETEFRRALMGSRGDLLVLVNRPIAAAVLSLALLMVLSPVIMHFWRIWRHKRSIT